MSDSSESRIASCRNHVLGIALSVTLLSVPPDSLLAQLECSNDTPIIGCGELVEVAPDSFVADFSQCLDSKGRDNRGLVVRLDTKAGEKFKCQLASRISQDPLLAFETGFYRIEAYLEYNRPDDLSQANESFYLEIAGQDTTGPCGLVNVANRFAVIPDTLKFTNVIGDSVRTVRPLGLFYLSAGDKIFFKHYQILLDPSLTPNPTRADSLLIQRDANGKRRFGEIESVHMFRMSLTRVEQASLLTLRKSASRTQVTPGGRVDYELDVENTSAAETARILRLTDILPASVTLGQITPTPTSVAGDTLVWLVPKLAPLASLKFKYSVTVADTFQNSSLPAVLVNAGTVTSSCGNASDTVRVTVIPACDVALAVSASADTVFPGETQTYTLGFVNNGPFTAFDGQLTAILPPLVSNFAANVPPTSVNGDTVIWRFDSLAVGVPDTISYRIDTPRTISPLPVTFKTSVFLEFDCGADSAGVDVVVIQPPPCDLSLQQVAARDTVIVGNVLSYSLVFNNNGPAAATDFQVLVTLPDSLFLVNASLPPAEAREDTLVWNLDSLAVGASDTIIYTLRVPTTLSPLPATLSSTGIILSNCGGDTSASTVVAISPPPCDVAVTLSATADSVIVGESLRYTLDVSNRGPASATGLNVVATFSDSVLFSEESKPPVSTSGNMIAWLLDSLTVGASDSFAFTVEVPAAGMAALPRLLAMETVAASECGSDTAALSVRVVPPPACDLMLVNAADADTVTVGDQLSYTLFVQNQGPAVAPLLTVFSILPDSVIFVSARPMPTAVSADTLFWEFDSLAAGAGDSITYSVQIPKTLSPLPQILESLSVARSECGSDSALVQTVAIPVLPCDLSLVNTSQVDSVTVGDIVNYGLRLSNFGPAVALDVMVVTSMPDSVEFLGASIPSIVATDGSFTWMIDSLAIGASDSITYQIRIPRTFGPVPQNLETLSIAGSECGTDTSRVTVRVVPPPPCLLNVTATASSDTVYAGDTFGYTLRINNSGPAGAPDLAVFATLPDSSRFARSSIDPTFSSGGDTLFWSFDSLAAGEDIVLDYDVSLVNSFLLSPLMLASTSGVSTSCGGDTTTSFVTAIDTTIQCRLQLSVTADADTVKPGTTVSYTLNVQNAGPD